MTKLSIATRQLHKVANIMVESFECCQENSCQIVTPCYLFKRSSLVSGSSLFLNRSKNNSTFGAPKAPLTSHFTKLKIISSGASPCLNRTKCVQEDVLIE